MPRTIPGFLAALISAVVVALPGLPALAASTTYRVQPPSEKLAFHDALKAAVGTVPSVGLTVAPVRAEEIQAVREENSRGERKALTIGLGRTVADSPESGSASLAWTPVPGGAIAHWTVSSTGADALRVGLDVARLAPGAEIRFTGNGSPVVYGPFTAADVWGSLGEAFWSPVLEGDQATIEIFSPDARSPALAAGVRVVQVSHLFVSAMNPRVQSLAKVSGACEVDLICLAASDAALANAGKATAKMTITDSGGNTGLCTGTLLNTLGGTGQNYFFTANHCFNENGRAAQAAVSTISTIWSYERSACGGGAVSSLQIGGGGRLLFADAPSDVLLLRLNRNPPPNAVFVGWDNSAVALGTRLWAVHHPAGDVKKVSLGSMGGYANTISGSPGNLLMTVLWDGTATGVTEGGSSGSAVFSAVGSPATEYRVRGGLFGGPSSCFASGSALRDYYSRLDTNYPYIDQYLYPGSSCAHSLSASGLSVGAAGGSQSVSVTTTPGCGWSSASEVDWITTSSAAVGSGAAQLTVEANNSGTARLGSVVIGKSSVAVAQPAQGAVLVNPTGLWSGGAGESGWGMNFNLQSDPVRGNLLFAAMYTYDVDGAPLWLVLSVGQGSGNAYSGPLYRATGPAFNASPWAWNPATQLQQVGTMTVVFSSENTGSMSYSVNGVVVNKTLSRFLFGTVPYTSCLLTSGSRAGLTNYQDMWENAPGGSEPGWGINIAHEDDRISANLYTYDATGKGLWLILSNALRQPDGAFAGDLFSVRGPAFNTTPWQPSAVVVTKVGTMTLRFVNGESGTMSYTVDGVPVLKSITRNVFAPIRSACQ